MKSNIPPRDDTKIAIHLPTTEKVGLERRARRTPSRTVAFVNKVAIQVRDLGEQTSQTICTRVAAVA